MKQFFVVALAALAAILSSQPTPREQVGFQPDGSFLLNSGWRIQPVGKQIPVGTFPMSSALAAGRTLSAGAQRRLHAAFDQRHRYE